MRALDQWENLVYREVPEVFINPNEVPRTSSPHLPPLAPPLLRPLLLCRRCQRRFLGHVLSLGRSPAAPPAPTRSTRRPQPEWHSSSSSLALLRACHAVPRLCRRYLAAVVALPVHAPSPPLFWFKSNTSSLSPHSIPVSSFYLPGTPSTTAAISSNSGALLFAVDSSLQPSPHHHNPLGSFPSLH
jgi:hypothetical protein